MVNGFRYYRALESVSIASALSTGPLLPFTHARFESINADSLNSNFLQLEEGVAVGHSGQFTPMRLPVNTVIHTTLVALQPSDRWSDALPVVPPSQPKRDCTKYGRLKKR